MSDVAIRRRLHLTAADVCWSLICGLTTVLLVLALVEADQRRQANR